MIRKVKLTECGRSAAGRMVVADVDATESMLRQSSLNMPLENLLWTFFEKSNEIKPLMNA